MCHCGKSLLVGACSRQGCVPAQAPAGARQVRDAVRRLGEENDRLRRENQHLAQRLAAIEEKLGMGDRR